MPLEAIDSVIFSAIVSAVPTSFPIDWLVVLETLVKSNPFTCENWWMPIAFVFSTNSQSEEVILFITFFFFSFL